MGSPVAPSGGETLGRVVGGRGHCPCHLLPSVLGVTPPKEGNSSRSTRAVFVFGNPAHLARPAVRARATLGIGEGGASAGTDGALHAFRKSAS